jgi:hypothetical protein
VPLDAFHSNLGVEVETVEPLAGDFNVGVVGAGGGSGRVVAEASLE